MERYKGFLRLRYVCDVPRQTIRAERHENAKLLLKVVRKQREGQGKEQDITSKTMTPVISVISQ